MANTFTTNLNLATPRIGVRTDLDTIDAIFKSDGTGTAVGINAPVHSSATTIALKTNGTTTAMFIDASQNVGIGTTTPGFKLVINSGYNNGLQIRDTTSTVYGGMFVESGNMAVRSQSNHPLLFATNDTERMRIDSSGNVGIGTTSPNGRIDFGTSAINTRGLLIYSNAVGKAYNGITQLSGEMRYYGDSNTNLTFGQISVSDGTTFTERMRIDTSGNVGIGTTSPSSLGKFVVLTASSDTTDLAVFQRASTATFRIRGVPAGLAMIGTQYADNLGFETNATERMRIDSSGNVGIGTSSPAVKLDVAGTIQLSSNIQSSAASYIYSYAGGSSGSVRSGLYMDGTNQVLQFYTGAGERARIDSSGRILVNSTSVLGSGTGRLQTYGVSGSYVGASFYMNTNGNDDWVEFTQPSGVSGRISKVGGTFTLTTVSDQRVKKDITDAPLTLNKLNALKVREFLMDGQDQRTVGLIAQEALAVMPEIVQVPKDPETEYYTVAYGNLMPHILKALQELKAEFDAYKASHP